MRLAAQEGVRSRTMLEHIKGRVDRRTNIRQMPLVPCSRRGGNSINGDRWRHGCASRLCRRTRVASQPPDAYGPRPVVAINLIRLGQLLTLPNGAAHRSRVHDRRLRAELFCPSPLQIHPRGTIEPKIIAVSNPYPISYDLSERAISTITSFGAAARSSWAQADPSARHRASRARQWCPSSSGMTRQFFPRLPQHRHGRPRESHLSQISKAAEEAASRQTECNGQG